MSVKAEELMTRAVVSAQPHRSVEHVRGMAARAVDGRVIGRGRFTAIGAALR